jgi:hypothetical protein
MAIAPENALPVASPGVRQGNPGRLAHAIIGVGLAIAATDREEDFGAESRDSRAGAERVREKAGSGRMLAELAFGTLKADKAAALLACDRSTSGSSRDHQRQYGQ